MKTNAVNCKKGMYIKLENKIYQIIDTSHNFRGRGGAFMRMKIRNIESGYVLEKNFQSHDILDLVDVERVQLQYLYKDENMIYFMDDKTYEQYEFPKNLSSGLEKFLKEGEKVFVLMYEQKIISIIPPNTVRLKVSRAETAVKGDTATSAKKEVILETGVSIMAPLFIKTGDIVVVNPTTGEYIERG